MPDRFRRRPTGNNLRLSLTVLVVVVVAGAVGTGVVLVRSPASRPPVAAHAKSEPSVASGSRPALTGGSQAHSPATAVTSSGGAVEAATAMGIRVLRVRIPGPVSHFTAQVAHVMLPPAARTRTGLPVLLLLAGTPGDTTNWLERGKAETVEASLAARNHGLAPIVIMADMNGSYFGDTECVDSPRGAAETYLTVDVRRYAIDRLHASSNPANWAIAGVSEGGTCSVMLALRHPSLYRTFVDFSGPTTPSVAETPDRSRTTAELFAGSSSAYNHHDPLWLLAHNRYPQLAGWFECGSGNGRDVQSQQALVAASKAAGLATVSRTTPGGHAWATWSTALSHAMPWVWARIAVKG